MFKAATIKDIAIALSLSPSTVSRALRDSFEVSEETKKNVRAYAQKVKYKSNPNALSLKNQRSRSIGVLVPDLANSFFSQTIDGIDSVAYKKGYHVIISQSHESYEMEVLNIEHLANRSVDGLLMSMSAQTTDYHHVKDLHVNGLPIVFFDRVLKDFETSKVTTNNYQASYQATASLIQRGHKKIAHLTNAPQLSISIDRLNGYKAALQDYQIDYDENLVNFCLEGGHDVAEVEFALNKFLNNSQKPDALFIASDMLSSATMRVLSKSVSHYPITVIGFSNSDVIDLLTPKISYIRQRAFEMGQIAAEMLIEIIENKHPIFEFHTKCLNADVHWIEEQITDSR